MTLQQNVTLLDPFVHTKEERDILHNFPFYNRSENRITMEETYCTLVGVGGHFLEKQAFKNVLTKINEIRKLIRKPHFCRFNKTLRKKNNHHNGPSGFWQVSYSDYLNQVPRAIFLVMDQLHTSINLGVLVRYDIMISTNLISKFISKLFACLICNLDVISHIWPADLDMMKVRNFGNLFTPPMVSEIEILQR